MAFLHNIIMYTSLQDMTALQTPFEVISRTLARMEIQSRLLCLNSNDRSKLWDSIFSVETAGYESSSYGEFRLQEISKTITEWRQVSRKESPIVYPMRQWVTKMNNTPVKPKYASHNLPRFILNVWNAHFADEGLHVKEGHYLRFQWIFSVKTICKLQLFFRIKYFMGATILFYHCTKSI